MKYFCDNCEKDKGVVTRIGPNVDVCNVCYKALLEYTCCGEVKK